MKAVKAFFAIYGEFIKQAYLCSKTPSDEFQAIQDAKFVEEASKPILMEEGEDND